MTEEKKESTTTDAEWADPYKARRQFWLAASPSDRLRKLEMMVEAVRRVQAARAERAKP